MRRSPLLLPLVFSLPLLAQTTGSSELSAILQRLDRLEQQNRELLAEVQQLRRQLNPSPAVAAAEADTASPAPPLEERLSVQERRTEELAQEKVSASQRLPLSITGMALFNAGWTSAFNGAVERPTTASLQRATNLGGGTFRQSVIGLKYEGPQVAGGGTVRGSLYLDLFGGTGAILNQLARIRVASAEIDWKNTSIMAGIEKPLIAPREPNSLAQVGVSPLTAAGNLWLWQPQARVEQRFRLAPDAGLRAQLSLFQTSERNATADPAFLDSLEQARPGLEGRFELWKDFGEGRRLEFAPGFHTSQTHVGGRSLPSRIFSLDWMLRPLPSLDFSGTWFRGSNVAVLGSMRQGVVPSLGRSVQAQGGWAQLSWRTTSRLTFNVYGGQQDDRNRDLIRGLVAKNQTWAANFIYRLGPNVLASFEAYKIRTTYLGSGNRMVNHYDLALAYLF